MKKQHWMSLILCFGIVSGSFAGNASGTVPINGGIAEPGMETVIELEKLYPDATYKVSCEIKNLNTTSDEESAFTARILALDTYGIIWLDGESIQPRRTYFYKSAGSKLTFSRIKREDCGLVIRNLDHTDSMLISNCEASIQQ